jgi:putative SOS response-associated peptidase YedK
MSTSLFGEARYNIAPSQQAPVIANVEGGNRIELFQWGLKSLVPKAEHQSETFAELCFVEAAMHHESLVGRHSLPGLQDNRR